jgi:hypothetical protein
MIMTSDSQTDFNYHPFGPLKLESGEKTYKLGSRNIFVQLFRSRQSLLFEDYIPMWKPRGRIMNIHYSKALFVLGATTIIVFTLLLTQGATRNQHIRSLMGLHPIPQRGNVMDVRNSTFGVSFLRRVACFDLRLYQV